MKCRHCQTTLDKVFLDLGNAPPSNAYLSDEDLKRPELYLPLRLFVCTSCFLVQTEDQASADTFFSSDYAYFSSTSQGWLDHAKRYANMVQERFKLDQDSLVIEVASNDGYLLRNFVAASIPCLGIEPTKSTADVAVADGIPTLQRFFGNDLAQELATNNQTADLIIGNNVFAHVPDINDFALGLAASLKPEGVVTLEFPHLMRLVEHRQFDTVYHEHFSYLSLAVVTKIFERADLRVFDVEEIPTHGGSLRVFGCRKNAAQPEMPAVASVLSEEAARGMDTLPYYGGFQAQANEVKNAFLHFLINAWRDGARVAGYGAAAKGNTLLNYAGVRPDLLPYVVDRAAAKVGKFMPGSQIPILSPDHLRRNRPDYLVIFPWNIAEEVCAQNSDLAKQGTRFVTAVPRLTIR